MGGRYGGNINGRGGDPWTPPKHVDIKRIPPTSYTQTSVTRPIKEKLD